MVLLRARIAPPGGWQPGICMKTAIATLMVLFSSGCSADVTLGFNGQGLSSMVYQGVEFVNNGHPEVENVGFSPQISSDLRQNSASRTAVDAGQGAISQDFPWGSLRTVYTVEGDKVLIEMTVTNSTDSSLDQLILKPLELVFPAKPDEHNGRDPVMGHSFWQPVILPFHYGSGVLAIVDEDVDKYLTMGLPWSLNAPTATIYPLKLNTGRNPMYPTNYPTINRPVPAQGSETFRISLRFGDAGTTVDQLAGDVYTNFTKAHPPLFSWPDRRPIGTLFMATAGTGFATNPRGWFNDPTIDVTTVVGRAAFRARMMLYAAGAAGIMAETHAQGMIAWDLEGEEDPAATYIGDPTLLADVAPEMDQLADDFFRVFTAAGLRVGVTIRMQQAVRSGGKVTHVPASDPVQHLAGLVAYAKQRWGATLFYVDSNDPFDGDTFRKVLAQYPDVLLIPEQKQTLHYGCGAPYEDARLGHAATPADVRKVYPDAFSVINFVDVATFQSRGSLAGDKDAFLFPGWYRDPLTQLLNTLTAPSQP